jgi:hypothetical protein
MKAKNIGRIAKAASPDRSVNFYWWLARTWRTQRTFPANARSDRKNEVIFLRSQPFRHTLA